MAFDIPSHRRKLLSFLSFSRVSQVGVEVVGQSLLPSIKAGCLTYPFCERANQFSESLQNEQVLFVYGSGSSPNQDLGKDRQWRIRLAIINIMPRAKRSGFQWFSHVFTLLETSTQ